MKHPFSPSKWLTLLLLWLLTACTPTAPAAQPTPTAQSGPKIVASTSWVAAFAAAAGATDITVIAPSNIQHPPDYDPKPSDLAAVADADYILLAGFEGFATRLQEAVGGDLDKIVMVMTENSPATIHAEVTRLAELFGTQAAAEAYLANFDQGYERLSTAVQAKVGATKPVVVAQLFATPWVYFAGLEPAGTYGPMPMTPEELKKLTDAQPQFVFENVHMGGGDPVVEATGATKIDLVNFPGDDLDLLEVFTTNAERISAALGGEEAPSSIGSVYPVTIENCGRCPA